MVTVPSAPPPNVFGSDAGPTSIVVRWSPILCEHRNGIIRGYYVKYRRFQPPGKENRIQVLGSKNTTVVLTGLDIFQNYSIQVNAFTVEGGNFSDSIVVTSGEIGKFGRNNFQEMKEQFLFLE